MENFKFELGQEVQDQISGFRGIIAGRSQWTTGCNTYGLIPKVIKNTLKEAEWFDENRLIKASSKIIKLGDKKPKQIKGGPQPIPRDK
jgi:hypothetical protein